MRILSDASFIDHADPLFFCNGISIIHDIYKLSVGLYMYDLMESELYTRTHSYDTRYRDDLLPDRARLTITQKS